MSWSSLELSAENNNGVSISGTSVHLSRDGQTMAVTAYPDWDELFIYKLEDDDWVPKGNPIHRTDIKDNGISYWIGRYHLELSGNGNVVCVNSYCTTGYQNHDGWVQVYAYNSGTGVWETRGSLLEGETNSNEGFGYMCALSNDGDLLVVGNIGNGVTEKARIYEWDGTEYITNETTKKIDSGLEGANNYSPNVRLSTDSKFLSFAIGGLWVKIYNIEDLSSDPVLVDTIYPPLGEGTQNMNWAADVAFTGNVLAIGDWTTSTDDPWNEVVSSGIVYMFRKNDNVWTPSTILHLEIEGDDYLPNDQFFFGWRLGLSSTTEPRLVVGSTRYRTTTSEDNIGSVNIYDYNGSEYIRTEQFIGPDVKDYQLGYDVAIAEDRVVAGSVLYTTGTPVGPPVVWQYTLNSSSASGDPYVTPFF